MSQDTRVWNVPPESLERERVDQFLARESGLSRSHVRSLIERGLARVDGRRVAADHRLRGGARVELDAPAKAVGRPSLKDRILHEDHDLLVLDKPAGLLMHPLGDSWLRDPAALAGEENLAARLWDQFRSIRVGRVPRCGIVHRLDRQTSGVLLVAKSQAAYEALTGAFKAREVEKTYRAVVAGCPLRDRSAVDAPVGRKPRRRLVTVTDFGKPAQTEVTVIARAPGAALIEARPKTGRTHQIRAHLAHLGHPVAGDPEFKAGLPPPPRLMLHAWRIELKHPRSGRPCAFTAGAPRDFRDYWESLRRAETNS